MTILYVLIPTHTSPCSDSPVCVLIWILSCSVLVKCLLHCEQVCGLSFVWERMWVTILYLKTIRFFYLVMKWEHQYYHFLAHCYMNNVTISFQLSFDHDPLNIGTTQVIFLEISQNSEAFVWRNVSSFFYIDSIFNANILFYPKEKS